MNSNSAVKFYYAKSEAQNGVVTARPESMAVENVAVTLINACVNIEFSMLT
jgi:hypothetical protein